MKIKTIVPKTNWIAWRLAGWLCRIACVLRKQKWYVGEAWHSVPGNRAADLQQQIWSDVVLISFPFKGEDEDARDRIGKNLNELAQAAGESWGHIWPKNKITPCP
jgi:hypothetical protein